MKSRFHCNSFGHDGLHWCVQDDEPSLEKAQSTFLYSAVCIVNKNSTHMCSRINATKFPASGTGNISKPRLMSSQESA
jgi:hypothetical protein